MDEHKIWYNKLMIEKTVNSLKKNGYNDIHVTDDIEQTKSLLYDIIKPGLKIGVGGSMTVKELNIVDELKKRGENKIIQHQPGTSIEERLRIWREALTADIYLASPQAVTTDGKLFFIDKYGNRVCATIFGPQKVILIAGYNKIVNDEKEALNRIRNISAVQNAHRLNIKTPCVITGKCSDCDTNDRICNVVSILYKKPSATDYIIIFVNKNLGY